MVVTTQAQKDKLKGRIKKGHTSMPYGNRKVNKI